MTGPDDWPGHRRNPSGIVAVLAEAGADLDASMVGLDGPSETPLHWAASNDDVELVDALLDAGANIEAPGSIIGGLGPIADAAVFGGTLAGLRLVERGARANIYQAAALGLTDRVQAELAARPGPDPERITTAFWAACGQRDRVEQPEPARRGPRRRSHRTGQLAPGQRRPPRRRATECRPHTVTPSTAHPGCGLGSGRRYRANH
jgi:hypothetical protein